VLSNAPAISPSGGPSLISLSKERASAAIGFLFTTGRLAVALGMVMLDASLLDLPRE
jgi:hypothetical protein